MESDEIEDVKEKTKSTDYKKMATAIGNMQENGVKISLPDINKSSFSFKVDLEDEKILFGLKGAVWCPNKSFLLITGVL